MDLANTNNEKPETKETWIKSRYIALLMGLSCNFFMSLNRMVIGVTMVDMVNKTALTNEKNLTSESCLNLLLNASDDEHTESFKREGEFNWTPKLQGYLLGSAYLVVILVFIPTGKLVEIVGCKKILTWGLFLSSSCMFIVPFAAWGSAYVLIIVYAFRTVFQVSSVPGMAVLIANWFPKSERGFSFTIMNSVSSWGAVLGSYFSSLLCDVPLLNGWPLPYFTFGFLGMLMSLWMAVFMHDNPTVHPKISPVELKYILENQENALTQRRPKTPWRSLLTSVPVYALSCAFFGDLWAQCHFFSIYPTFLGTILHYPIKQNGLFSALPFVLQFVISLMCGWLSKFLTDKKHMKTGTAQKLWNSVASFGYSACMFGIYFAGCNRNLSIIFGISSSAFIGFSKAGCWITSPHMSPTFAGSINGVACTIGFFASFILPLVVGFLTNDMQTMTQWDKIHFISAGVVAFSGLVFNVFGSAEVQPWNDVSKEDTDDTKKETRLNLPIELTSTS